MSCDSSFSFAELSIRTIYNLLLERVPAPPEAEHPKLHQKDFELIDYWYKHQWVLLLGDCVTDLFGKVENENEEMASRFEELQYCNLDWKAEQIAIDTFPG
jgi:hypothetical protein